MKSCVRLFSRVCFQSASRLFAGSVVLMKNALGGSLVDLFDRILDENVLVSCVGLNGDVGLFESSLKSRLGGLVSLSLRVVDENTFFSRLDVRHV